MHTVALFEDTRGSISKYYSLLGRNIHTNVGYLETARFLMIKVLFPEPKKPPKRITFISLTTVSVFYFGNRSKKFQSTINNRYLNLLLRNPINEHIQGQPAISGAIWEVPPERYLLIKGCKIK